MEGIHPLFTVSRRSVAEKRSCLYRNALGNFTEASQKEMQPAHYRHGRAAYMLCAAFSLGYIGGCCSRYVERNHSCTVLSNFFFLDIPSESVSLIHQRMVKSFSQYKRQKNLFYLQKIESSEGRIKDKLVISFWQLSALDIYRVQQKMYFFPVIN